MKIICSKSTFNLFLFFPDVGKVIDDSKEINEKSLLPDDDDER